MPKPEAKPGDEAFGTYPILVNQPAYAPSPVECKTGLDPHAAVIDLIDDLLTPGVDKRGAVRFPEPAPGADEADDGDRMPDSDPEGVWFAEKVVRWFMGRDREELESLARLCGVEAEWLGSRLVDTAMDTPGGLFPANAPRPAPPATAYAPAPPSPVARTDLYVIQRSQGKDRPPQFWACSAEHGTGWHDGTPRQAFTKSEISTTLLTIADVCGDLGDSLRIRRLFLA